MDVRVVCGLSATIATFWPTSTFSSVDLPAFGRPTSDTNPERNLLMSYGLRPVDSHLADAQFVTDQHIQQRGFAGVRASNERYESRAEFTHELRPETG